MIHLISSNYQELTQNGTNLATTSYYLFNGHGDVTGLTNTTGALVWKYDYDAFGNEREISGQTGANTNPFRYCGEYFDGETGSVYLRARYYDPGTGRFEQEDTHWNVRNMVYGDDPLKLNTYTVLPSMFAIMQSGNLYVYCMANPISHTDPNGSIVFTFIGATVGAFTGALSAWIEGKSAEEVKNSAIAGAVGGAIMGAFADITGGTACLLASTVIGGIAGFVSDVTEQLLNGTNLSAVDWGGALKSAGVGAAFSVVDLGLGKMIDGSFVLNRGGKTLLESLVDGLTVAGVTEAGLHAFFSAVFSGMPQAMVDALVSQHYSEVAVSE